MNTKQILSLVLCVVLMGLVTACKDKKKNNDVTDPTDKQTATTTGTENGHDWIDIGLSVRWATMNIGATTPEGYGNYYAWGETTSKASYSWDTYTHCIHTGASDDGLTKYCIHSNFGHADFTDGLTQLVATDDAATANWGGKWRMPTLEECKALSDNCTWEWVERGNVKGREITGPNGGKIFLPATGYKSYDAVYYDKQSGTYWSKELSSGNSQKAVDIVFSSSNHEWAYGDRDHGFPVRAVCPK